MKCDSLFGCVPGSRPPLPAGGQVRARKKFACSGTSSTADPGRSQKYADDLLDDYLFIEDPEPSLV